MPPPLPHYILEPVGDDGETVALPTPCVVVTSAPGLAPAVRPAPLPVPLSLPVAGAVLAPARTAAVAPAPSPVVAVPVRVPPGGVTVVIPLPGAVVSLAVVDSPEKPLASESEFGFIRHVGLHKHANN